MSMTLIKTRLFAGVWEGVLTQAGETAPTLAMRHLEKTVGSIEITQEDAPGQWLVRAMIPPETLSDGVQTFLIVDEAQDIVLNSFHLLAGEGLSEDIRAELELMRAELDMLKKAFRRHCSETAKVLGAS